MRRACRNEKRIPRLQRDRLLVAKLVLKGSLQHVGDLFAGVRVLRREGARIKVDADLNGFAARGSQK